MLRSLETCSHARSLSFTLTHSLILSLSPARAHAATQFAPALDSPLPHELPQELIAASLDTASDLHTGVDGHCHQLLEEQLAGIWHVDLDD